MGTIRFGGLVLAALGTILISIANIDDAHTKWKSTRDK
ncbi:hypothetical protein SAMN05421855_10481 [Ulvibacter litoralis]|uniref:Uncharacterized protein n=1 Tax=Ulvibacter litoralis TaxID=227084 RepID=A0A1G7HGM5_9FLAO|nr:hypothetical protein SAMN05421855_10481 [Ulvibacter litoralis]